MAGPGTSIALSQYRRNISRPSGVRDPTRAPKSNPRGYPETNASGKTINSALSPAASVGESLHSLERAIAVKRDGGRLDDGGSNGWHEGSLSMIWLRPLTAGRSRLSR